jgi:hypothetical protein
MNTRQLLSCLLLVIVTLVTSTQDLVSIARASVTTPSQTSREAKRDLKQEIILIPAGSILEVRLVDKRKLTGRLGEVTDEGFELQYVKGDKVVKESIVYKDVKSYKQRNREGMSTGAKVALGMLAGVGVLFVVLLIVAAASGWD